MEQVGTHPFRQSKASQRGRSGSGQEGGGWLSYEDKIQGLASVEYGQPPHATNANEECETPFDESKHALSPAVAASSERGMGGTGFASGTRSR